MKKSEKGALLRDAAISGAAADAVSRYGGAVKEHLVAYLGRDNEFGTQLKRSLKSISESSVNPDFVEQNLKQQAGFSAEVKIVARARAEEQITGKKPTTVRTDDLPGHVNDPLYDVTSAVDASGNPIPGASMQVKFVGSSPEAALGKLMGKDFQKYIDNDCKIGVPSDFYDGIKEEIAEKSESLRKQIGKLRESGNERAAANKQAQLDKLQKLDDKLLQKTDVSNAEAMEARTDPLISTAKDVLKTAHRAGVDQLKFGAAIGGGMSIATNLVSVLKGKKKIGTAAKSVAKDTATAAAASYATGFIGAVVKGTAQNASSECLRTLSKTNLPAYIATATLEVGKTMTAYFKGEIDGVECVEQLGIKGYSMVSSAMYAGIGQVLIPIPVVGAMVGSMVGCMICTASYDSLKRALKEEKFAREERKRIEKACAQWIAYYNKCKLELQAMAAEYFNRENAFFSGAFTTLEDCAKSGDIEGYILATNKTLWHLGVLPVFHSKQEFDGLMLKRDSELVI